jgi:hypothetical protein
MTTLKADFLFPDDIRNDSRIQGFAEALGVIYDNIGTSLDKLKIWDIDNQGEEQLDAFAREISLRSYSECSNVTEKRAFCKIGAEIQRFSGSPWAITTALETFGFTNVLIWENETLPAATANGQYKATGWVLASSLVIFSGNFFSISADNMTGNEEKAARIIKNYKPASAYLLSVFNN